MNARLGGGRHVVGVERQTQFTVKCDFRLNSPFVTSSMNRCAKAVFLARKMPSIRGLLRRAIGTEQLGEDEDWLHDVANEMEIEDGVIRVYGAGEDGVLAFADA
jgi:hypothetical protein